MTNIPTQPDTGKKKYKNFKEGIKRRQGDASEYKQMPGGLINDDLLMLAPPVYKHIPISDTLHLSFTFGKKDYKFDITKRLAGKRMIRRRTGKVTLVITLTGDVRVFKSGKLMIEGHITFK